MPLGGLDGFVVDRRQTGRRPVKHLQLRVRTPNERERAAERRSPGEFLARRSRTADDSNGSRHRRPSAGPRRNARTLGREPAANLDREVLSPARDLIQLFFGQHLARANQVLRRMIFVPVFFAGIVFAIAFRDSRQPGVSISARISAGSSWAGSAITCRWWPASIACCSSPSASTWRPRSGATG